MAEFLGNPKLHRTENGPTDGFNAFGKPVPIHRREAADVHLREMGITDTQDRWNCIQTISEQIQRDEPYDAMATATRYVDLTGAYRLLAVLLMAKPKKEGSQKPFKGMDFWL